MKKIIPLFAFILVVFLAVCSFSIIPTGYTGVKTSFGQIQETTIQSGKLNFCSRSDRMTIIRTKSWQVSRTSTTSKEKTDDRAYIANEISTVV